MTQEKEYRKLAKRFVSYETKRMGVKRERVVEEAVESFLEFVERRKIKLRNLDELYYLNEMDIIEYFILLKDKSGDNELLFREYAQINLRFLYFLKDAGYIKKATLESNDRVREREAEYLCA